MISIVNTECHVPKTFSDLAKIAAWGRLGHKARITPALFERWLALWVQTTNDRMTPEAAAALQAKARRIAESLQLAMFFQLEERSAASVANAERKDAIERPGQTHG